MCDDDSHRREPAAVREDRKFREAVIYRVLELHPTHLRVVELVREMTAGREEEFEDSDAIERAVRDLTGAGLLHCPGGIVMPTNAALCFAELSEEHAD